MLARVACSAARAEVVTSLPEPQLIPSSRRRAQGKRSREKILDAAETLMSERGYAATGISAISRRSGLPASSIYWHFENKQGLVAAVMERSALRWIADLEHAQDPPGNPAERLGRLLVRGFTTLEERPPEFLRLAIFLSLERSDDPNLVESLRRVRERSGRILVTALEAVFAEAGDARAHQVAEECSNFALAFCEGCFIGHQMDPEKFDFEKLAAQLHVALLAIGKNLMTRPTEISP